MLEEFIGEGGDLTSPESIFNYKSSKREENVKYGVGEEVDGFEAIGAIRFQPIILQQGEKRTYYILLNYNEEGLSLLEPAIEMKAFEESKQYWENQSNILVETKCKEFDNWLQWVGIQPTLRRIYGCSFLPHHDYGRGGRGFRDLWQDSLALLLMSKESIRENLISYYGGIRMDGSNATIIGKEPGEFIADRNAIARVWMDHGVWPFITTVLYINQTGDYELLFESNSYFKDSLTHRGEKHDALFDGYEKEVKTYNNIVYKGSILEHILIQNLTAYFDVGEHGHMKLLGADWNDALDMAKEHGESVAFSAAYAGNLENLSELLRWLYEEKNIKNIELAVEVTILLNQGEEDYSSDIRKNEILSEYCNACCSYISGKKELINTLLISEDLHKKATNIKQNIRNKEWISTEQNNLMGWFNSYYDNHKRMVEGKEKDSIRMMLTGQVFTIMSNTATDEQVAQIVTAADKYLFEKEVGGYRLNTNFKEIKTDLGRMFGFAYGHKENGAVFCHMAVMYAKALYSRGFVKEGYKVIDSLFQQAQDFECSRIIQGYPNTLMQKEEVFINI